MHRFDRAFCHLEMLRQYIRSYGYHGERIADSIAFWAPHAKETHVRIEHLAMYVNDLESTKTFFERYFDASCPGELYHNPTTGFRSYFLTFEDGARLEIMNKELMEDPKKTPARTGFIHVAFSVGSRERVDELTAQLREDGYEVLSGPRTTGDGYYESCIAGPEGNQIEITV